MRVIALDPGNSTGWCCRINNNELVGGTVDTNHLHVWQLLENVKPDIIVYETFNMYPGKAQKLIWNSFYPVEVIGVIKVWQMLHPDVKIVGLPPSCKQFALSSSETELWKSVKIFDHTFDYVSYMFNSNLKATEHTRDAVRLLRYYERNYK